MPRVAKSKAADSTANLGFEAKLWLAADTAMRDSASLPREAIWRSLREAKDNHRLGELIDLIGTIGLGDKESRSKDILGRVYEPSEARQTAQSAARRVSAANQYFLTQPSGARSTMRSIARRVPRRRHQFASAEGKNGGHSSGARKTAEGSPQGERGGVHQFYTPSCVVRLLVEMLAPYTALRGSAFLQSEAKPQVVSAAKDNGRIYDPACGSGGSLPASRLCGVRFAEKDSVIAPGGVQSQGQDSRSEAETDEVKWARRQRPFGLAPRARRVRLRRQQPKQSNATTRRLAIMNLAIRGIEATAMRDSALQPREAIPQSASEARDNFGPEHADTFRRDLHPDLRADYVLATAERDSALLKAKPDRRACHRQDNPMPLQRLRHCPARQRIPSKRSQTAGRERSEGQFPHGRRRALATERSEIDCQRQPAG